LAGSIRRHGVKDPLTVTRDGYILSGHRRHAASRLAGLKEVPCFIEPVTRSDPQFVELLVTYNNQRVKSFDEVVREEVVSINPKEARRAIIEYRQRASEVVGEFMEIVEGKARKKISQGKMAMVNAICEILEMHRKYWPISIRQVHYDLLNDPPLRHSKKPDSTYVNDRRSYQNLSDLLTRMRVSGMVPFDAIGDETREVVTWSGVHKDVGSFIRKELDGFLAVYWRDLQQSQPNHIEIVGEKNTIRGVINPVASEFCIPYTLGRGYSSIDPVKQMADRYRKSGKEKLILLIMSDFDPEGEDIANVLPATLCRDFAIPEWRICCKKVCMTWDQVQARNLPENREAGKETSARYKNFVRKYGPHFYELETLPMEERSRMLEDAIVEVMDVDAYNREIGIEADECAKIMALKNKIGPMISEALGKSV
jgi:hypothetical protein